MASMELILFTKTKLFKILPQFTSGSLVLALAKIFQELFFSQREDSHSRLTFHLF